MLAMYFGVGYPELLIVGFVLLVGIVSIKAMLSSDSSHPD